MKTSDIKLVYKGLLMVSIPLFFELVFVATLFRCMQQADYEAWRQAHSRTVISEVNNLTVLVYKAGEILLTFRLNKSQVGLDRLDEVVRQITEQSQLLKRLAADDPQRKQVLLHVDELANNALSIILQARALLDKDEENLGIGSLVSLSVDANQAITSLLKAVNDFVEEERKIETLDPRSEERARTMVMVCLLVGIAVNIAAAVALALFFGKEVARRLGVVVDNASRLSKEKALSPPLSGKDEIAHLDHVFHDMADALNEAARRKQEILEMVSHDLRSPLTSINFSLKMLAKGVSGEMSAEANEEVCHAERNTERLIKLINDLLDIEKIKSGQFELAIAPVEISSLFERSIEAVRSTAEQKNVQLKTDAGGKRLSGDEERLIQVVINLLSNAIKYSPAGGTVWLSAEQGAYCVEITVRDEGCGIPDEFKESIFERFQQVQGTGKKGSSGLGLTICKKIVEEHGGTIGVRSEPGNGSTFWFRLPDLKRAS